MRDGHSCLVEICGDFLGLEAQLWSYDMSKPLWDQILLYLKPCIWTVDDNR